MASIFQNDVLSALITDIKTYKGKDPLTPWLRGIRTMKECIPSKLLKEKLPRFLQRCAQTFENDGRYRNDVRYLRVWLELMDFVDDPRAILKRMEMNHIGIKRSLFYQAYALSYERIKKFEAAEKMYHLGVQNLAEPAEELQRSYDEFLYRMERRKNKKIQKRPDMSGGCEDQSKGSKQSMKDDKDDILIDTAVIGRPEAEDVCHHGFVDPTINTKEAVNVMNSVLREPLDRSCRNHSIKSSGDNVNDVNGMLDKKNEGPSMQRAPAEMKSLIDEDGNDQFYESRSDRFVFTNTEHDLADAAQLRFGEDTVVCRFVGSAILDEPKVEDAFHHGLVDPTINLKEAMDDINGMFGKPIDFVRPTRQRKSGEVCDKKGGSSGFSVLPDESNSTEFVVFADCSDLECQSGAAASSSQQKSQQCDLLEPTVCTKDAMEEINKMFGMPLDF